MFNLRVRFVTWLQKKAWAAEDARLLRSPDLIKSLEEMKNGETFVLRDRSR